ncbi:proteasome accessory factor PafA2 family protein, partial [Streptomyces sp. NPDC002814]
AEKYRRLHVIIGDANLAETGDTSRHPSGAL